MRETRPTSRTPGIRRLPPAPTICLPTCPRRSSPTCSNRQIAAAARAVCLSSGRLAVRAGKHAAGLRQGVSVARRFRRVRRAALAATASFFCCTTAGSIARPTARGRFARPRPKRSTRLDAGSWFGRRSPARAVPTLDAFLSAVPAGVSCTSTPRTFRPRRWPRRLTKHGLVERTVVYQSADYLEKLQARSTRGSAHAAGRHAASR